MTQPSRPTPSQLLTQARLLEANMRRAGREAIRQHALAGRSIPVWQDGQVVWLSPEAVLAELSKAEHG